VSRLLSNPHSRIASWLVLLAGSLTLSMPAAGQTAESKPDEKEVASHCHEIGDGFLMDDRTGNRAECVDSDKFALHVPTSSTKPEVISMAEESKLSTLSARLERFEDESAIANVLTDYSLALDWLDVDLLDSVFWDDATIDYGFFKGTGAEFKPILLGLESSFGRRWHFTSQLRIALAGNTAKVSSYNFSVATTSQAAPDAAGLTGFFGYYVDRLEKREGRWAIASRKHLLVAGTNWADMPIIGDLAALNGIGKADTTHVDFSDLPID
jgi:hypothetical protein